MSAPIEFYFDFISPYAYFGSARIDALASRYGRQVDWRPVLIGITILKVMGLKPLLQTPLKGDYLYRDAPRVARLLGVPFRHHGLKGVNSLAASRAYLYLKGKDPELARRFAKAIYRTLWVEGRDITPPEVAADVGETLDAPRQELLAAVESDAAKEALKSSVDAAIAKGVFGVPYFIVDDQPIWGSDRLWMLEHWLAHGSWDPAPAKRA